MMAVHVVAAVAGAAVVLATLVSALETVVVPRAGVTRLTWVHFAWLRQVFEMVAHPRRDFLARDRVLAVYAPLALVALPGAWVTLVILGFSLIFWGTGVGPYAEALAISGSSLTTLGFERPEGLGRELLGVTEAALGLGLVALMISYLPSIYSAFQRREKLVGGLQVRAGLPPTPLKLFQRYATIGWFDRVNESFNLWESWFTDIEESHTSQAWLVFFRSPHPQRSWITAAGCILDTTALYNAVIDRPHDPQADILLRSGYLCLRRIATSFEIRYDDNPAPDDPITVTRDEFDEVCAELRETGVALVADLDQGWRDFAGWRVNYDTVLVALAAMISAPPAPWTSDRSVLSPPPRFIRRRGHRALARV
jgi:hypothetical protein